MNDPPVLYQRAKASDMLQGMIDMVTIFNFELQKFQKFHGDVYGMAYYRGLQQLEQDIRNLDGRIYMLKDVVLELRQKGL